MNIDKFLEITALAEKLKNSTRHCYTSDGRRESVAEHCWRISFMAMLLKDEFPDADIDKIIKMCIIHDFGEAFTGDIPVFEKTEKDEQTEGNVLNEWLKTLPKPYDTEFIELFNEMKKLETQEAKIYKALDGLEALIQHNESDISTWLPLEYDLQLTYADDKVAFSPYFKEVREKVRFISKEKIEKVQE